MVCNLLDLSDTILQVVVWWMHFTLTKISIQIFRWVFNKHTEVHLRIFRGGVHLLLI
jgi:hypothetical protein